MRSVFRVLEIYEFEKQFNCIYHATKVDLSLLAQLHKKLFFAGMNLPKFNLNSRKLWIKEGFNKHYKASAIMTYRPSNDWLIDLINPIWHGGGDIFISLSLLDLIFSADFSNFQSFGVENLHQSGYFDTLPSSLSLINDVPWRLLLSNIMPDKVNALSM